MNMFLYQYVIPWLKSVVKEHHELVVALLLPHPIEYAKVGGVWYVAALPDRSTSSEFIEGKPCPTERRRLSNRSINSTI